MQIKSIMKYVCNSLEWIKCEKTDKPSAHEDVEQLELSF